jgi:anti-sigma factor ChrR (cupin superfamily)
MMRRTVLIALLIGLAVGGTLAIAQTASQHNHAIFTPADLQWVDGPPTLPKGVKMAVLEGNPRDVGPFTLRFMLPAGTKVPPHWHPGIEHVTVLSGTFNIGLGEKFDEMALKALPPGGFVMMQPKTPHFVHVKEETTIQVHAIGPWGVTYVNPEDDPSKKS